MTNLGLYFHIPFCEKRCAYCDFYSGIYTDELIDKYIDALQKEIKQWGGKINRPIDTIYFGGGTPSLLNHRLIPLLETVRENFTLTDDAEITMEINPHNNIFEVLQNAKKAGVNRLSIGAQSGIDSELKTLGRTHTTKDTKNAVKIAKELGFENISLDLMIGLPDSNIDSLKQNLNFIVDLSPQHISCYILKIEKNTAFEKKLDLLKLPCEDQICEQYMFMSDYLNKSGYEHYEISNFCKVGFEGRHNLKYWKCQEYLGIGPSAHSFLNGERFYYPNNLHAFIKGCSPVFDGYGGSDEEKLMLGIRLNDGIDFSELPKNKIDLFIKNNLCQIKNNKLCLTDKGMLVSNEIITQLLEN